EVLPEPDAPTILTVSRDFTRRPILCRIGTSPSGPGRVRQTSSRERAMGSVIRHTALFVMLLMSAVLPSHAMAASTVLIFGDSLTAGYRLQAEEALPAVVEAKLHEKGEADVTVINGGVS